MSLSRERQQGCVWAALIATVIAGACMSGWGRSPADQVRVNDGGGW